MMASTQFRKLIAPPSITRVSQAATSNANAGAFSLFSSIAPAPVTTNKKPSPISNYGRSNFPTTLLPSNTPTQPRISESQLMKSALADIKKKQSEEIGKLEWLLDTMRIAQMPSPSSVVPDKQQHTFQVMNRNARKAKRANHGKRPCSRDRRRWKTKSWANTSRRG